MARKGLLVHEVLLDVRHPAWVPVSPGGETPRVFGAGVTPVANDWQPLAIGSRARDVGTAADYVRFDPDNGLMVTLSAYGTSDTIEDHTGDGDTVVQMVSHQIEQPQERTLDFDWTDKGKWIERFIWTVFDDPPKRPLDLRERYVTVEAAAATINLGAGYAVAWAAPLVIDGAGAANLAVDDLITLDGTATVYRVTSRTATSVTLDKPLVAALDDDDVVARAAIDKSIQQSYYAQPSDKRAAKGVMGMTVSLVPTGDFARTGMTT